MLAQRSIGVVSERRNESEQRWTGKGQTDVAV